MPVVAPRSAASTSASARTMFGDLPPSSSVIFLSVSAAALMIPLPVLVSPVKAILSMPGCSTIACPTLEPGPVITLSTPGGSPTSTAISPSAIAVSGVWLAGFRITTLPQASAGATFDAERLAQRVGEVVPLDRDRLPHHLVGPSGVVLEAFGGRGNLDLARLEDRLAVVQGLEARDLVGALHQTIGQPADEAPALARRHLAPRPVQRRARRLHR